MGKDNNLFTFVFFYLSPISSSVQYTALSEFSILYIIYRLSFTQVSDDSWRIDHWSEARRKQQERAEAVGRSES